MKNFILIIGLVFSISSTSYTQCTHPDYQALMAIYNALDGPNWTYNGGWVDGVTGANCNVCDWDYVTCDNNNRVISFSSYSNGYNGTIPSEIGDFEFLERINLSYGTITNGIPEELYQLTNLKRLSLADVDLTGTISSSIGNLVNLEYLILSNNSIEGDLPNAIGNCTKLKEINLIHNDLVGPLPNTLGNFTQIEILELSSNDIDGNLPEMSGGMLYINEFDLDHNNITGMIPASYGNLENFYYLGFANNNLSGCIPNNLLNLCDKNVNISGNNSLEGTGDFSDFCNTGAGSCDPVDVINLKNKNDLFFNTFVNDYLILNRSLDQNTTIQVYNMQGGLVLNNALIESDKIDLTLLIKGIYIVKFNTAKGDILTAKIFKN